MLSIYIIDLH